MKAVARPLIAAGALLAGAAFALRLLGRSWWCACGSARLSSWDIWSSHNSQHLLDPYSFTHILHGLLFYALLHLLLAGRAGHVARLVLALTLEAAWEVLENTSWVIEAYRQSTISLDYYGDSILNSLMDMMACASGYVLALAIPVRLSVTVYAAVELALLYWVRDNLFLSSLMLLFPVEAIKSWQMGG